MARRVAYPERIEPLVQFAAGRSIRSKRRRFDWR